MQVASEMFSKLQSLAASVSQSLGLEQRPDVLMKQQLQRLLSAAVYLLQTAGIRVPVNNAQDEGTEQQQQQQQVSPLRRAASVAMDLLHKIKAVSAYLCSSVYSATVSTGGRLAESLQAEWKNFKLSNHGKNAMATAENQEQEDSKSSAVVNTAPEHALPLEPVFEIAEPTAVEMESHPEESVITETEDTRRVEAEDAVEPMKEETCRGDSEKHQSLQTATDSSPSQQPLEEQTSLHQENEVSTAIMRPHSKTFSSIFRRSSKTKARTSSINQ